MNDTRQHRNWISWTRMVAANAARTLAAGLILAGVTTLPAQAQIFNTLYSFPGGADGEDPNAALLQGTDGNLYGTTQFGGAGSRLQRQFGDADANGQLG